MLSLLLLLFPLVASAKGESVVFFHPDGMSLSHWTAVRLATVGPDGETNWDKLPRMAVYRGHMKDALSATSNGGATSHAFGRKVNAKSFGMDGSAAITSASGFNGSVMKEAKARGKAIGLVQSGHIAEPGTAAFLASVPGRDEFNAEIAKQVLFSEPDISLSGGERYLLPKGVKGRFGEGQREDGLNLIEWAKEKGYTVVYDREALRDLPKEAKRVLGVFAWNHTFNDESEEALAKAHRPLYLPEAPTIGEMTEAALGFLARRPQGFFLVAEEEGTDNFSNANNAKGFLEAGRRADLAVGVIADFVKKHPRTLLVMASDSDAGGLEAYGADEKLMPPAAALPKESADMARPDGQSGTASAPFLAAPDRAGRRLPFAILWTGKSDVTGGILVRGTGYRSEKIQGSMDNTAIFTLVRETLLGK